MPTYTYIAINPEGKRITQTLTASSPEAAYAKLQKERYFVVNLREQSKSSLKHFHLSLRQKIYFTQNIATLLSSGISLGEAISIIAADTKDKRVAAFYQHILEDLERGTAMSDSLSHFPDSFDEIYLSLVRSGENSGHLDTVMDSIGKNLERDARTIQQVRSALMYPSLVFMALGGLGLIIVFFVLPKLTKIFSELDVTLPLLTRILIKTGEFVGGNMLISALAILFALIMLIVLYHIRPLRTRIMQVLIRLPLIQPVVENLDLSRLTATLSLLLNSGVAIQDALTISAGTVQDKNLVIALRNTSDKLASGKSLAVALADSPLPRTMTALVAVGERSGKTAEILGKLSKHYEEQLDSAIKNFTTLIEPILTLVVGILVAIVIMSIMLPIYQFMGTLDAAAQ